MDAVRRCEGDADACADPSKNAALGRAGRAAREAGVSDRLIAEAIALARRGESEWAAVAAAPRAIRPTVVATTPLAKVEDLVMGNPSLSNLCSGLSGGFEDPYRPAKLNGV